MEFASVPMPALSAVCDDVDVQGLPLLKPPYGTIAAVDLTKGEVLWEIPNGETPDEITQPSRRSQA